MSTRGQKAQETLEAYRRLFSTEDGQIVLKDLMASSSFLTPTIGKDPYMTYFNEGARSVVLRISETSKLELEEISKLVEQISKDNAQMYDI